MQYSRWAWKTLTLTHLLQLTFCNVKIKNLYDEYHAFNKGPPFAFLKCPAGVSIWVQGSNLMSQYLVIAVIQVLFTMFSATLTLNYSHHFYTMECLKFEPWIHITSPAEHLINKKQDIGKEIHLQFGLSLWVILVAFKYASVFS